MEFKMNTSFLLLLQLRKESTFLIFGVKSAFLCVLWHIANCISLGHILSSKVTKRVLSTSVTPSDSTSTWKWVQCPAENGIFPLEYLDLVPIEIKSKTSTGFHREILEQQIHKLMVCLHSLPTCLWKQGQLPQLTSPTSSASRAHLDTITRPSMAWGSSLHLGCLLETWLLCHFLHLYEILPKISLLSAHLHSICL